MAAIPNGDSGTNSISGENMAVILLMNRIFIGINQFIGMKHVFLMIDKIF